MDMPGREYVASEAYGYEFNGKETDEETFDGAQDFGLREYDDRLGRFFSKDPFSCVITNKSPYSFAGNSPITFIDKNGGFMISSEMQKKYPALDNMLRTISNAANQDPTLNNPYIRQFIFWSGLPMDQSGLDEALSVLSYGSGPLINVVETKEYFGYYPTNGGQSIYLSADLAKNLGKTNNIDKKGAYQLAAFFVIWHEGIHYSNYYQNMTFMNDIIQFQTQSILDVGDMAVINTYGMPIRAITTINPNDGIVSVREDILNANRTIPKIGSVERFNLHTFFNSNQDNLIVGEYVNPKGISNMRAEAIKNSKVFRNFTKKAGEFFNKISNIFKGSKGTGSSARYKLKS